MTRERDSYKIPVKLLEQMLNLLGLSLVADLRYGRRKWIVTDGETIKHFRSLKNIYIRYKDPEDETKKQAIKPIVDKIKKHIRQRR